MIRGCPFLTQSIHCLDFPATAIRKPQSLTVLTSLPKLPPSQADDQDQDQDQDHPLPLTYLPGLSTLEFLPDFAILYICDHSGTRLTH